MNWIWTVNILSVFFLCVFSAGIVIPQILLIAFRKRLFDEPDERKIHQGVVPRLGGMAFKPIVFFSFALVLAVNVSMGHGELLKEIGAEALPLTYAFCAMIMLYLVGIADDLIGVRYSAKFFVQVACGVMLVSGGVVLTDFHGLFFIHRLASWITMPMTVLVVVFIINSVNLIDGIDGLASGLCSVALLFYGVIFFYFGQHLYAMFSFATLGVLIPFFYYNVFGKAEKGRKIFMGDTGTLTIGVILCFLGIQISHVSDNVSPHHINPFVLAFAPLIVPCFDVVRVYMQRVRNGKNPFLPDKNHIHHKLLAIGMGQRTAMGVIVLSSTVLTLLNIVLSAYIGLTFLLCLDVVLWVVVNVLVSNRMSAM